MKIKKIVTLLLISSFLLFMFQACTDKSDDIPTFASAPTLASLIEQGWADFRAKNFDDAVQKFQEANERDALNLDSYIGLGWANMMIKKFSLARANFAKAITFGAGNSTVLSDCYSGLAGIDLADGQLENAINNVDLALSYQPDFVLTEEPSINKLDLYLIKAQAYFKMEKYNKSVEFVEMIQAGFINPSNTNFISRTDTISPVINDTTQVTGNARLQMPDTAWVTYETRVLPDTTFIDTIIHRVARKTIQIQSINNLDNPGAILNIIAIIDGTNNIDFFSNPIPDASDRYKIEYYYAFDYGRFLSDLSIKLQDLKTQLD